MRPYVKALILFGYIKRGSTFILLKLHNEVHRGRFYLFISCHSYDFWSVWHWDQERRAHELRRVERLAEAVGRRRGGDEGGGYRVRGLGDGRQRGGGAGQGPVVEEEGQEAGHERDPEEGKGIGELVVAEGARAVLPEQDQHQHREGEGEAQGGRGPEGEGAEDEPPQDRAAGPQRGGSQSQKTGLQPPVLQVGEGRGQVLREDHHVDADQRQRRRGPEPGPSPLAQDEPGKQDLAVTFAALESRALKWNSSQLANIVTTLGADLGICISQDAETIVLIDEKGHIVAGDKLLALMTLLGLVTSTVFVLAFLQGRRRLTPLFSLLLAANRGEMRNG